MNSKYTIVDKIDLMIIASGDHYVSQNGADTKNFMVTDSENTEYTLVVSGAEPIKRISGLSENILYTFRRLSQAEDLEDKSKFVYVKCQISMIQTSKH